MVLGLRIPGHAVRREEDRADAARIPQTGSAVGGGVLALDVVEGRPSTLVLQPHFVMLVVSSLVVAGRGAVLVASAPA